VTGTYVGFVKAALKRRPVLIPVDELAHTNMQGSCHPKRWQDVALDVEWHAVYVETRRQLDGFAALIATALERVHYTSPNCRRRRP
jgi:two-component system sensor histidine kinase KdpD